MQKKVSADTISKITLKSGFAADTNIVPPTTDELIQQIKKRLSENISHIEKKVINLKKTRSDSSEPISPFEISLRRAQEQLIKFEALVSTDLPKGFKLTPLLYSKVTREENAKTWKEFAKKVKRPFISFLGNNHADELKNLGLCQHAIDKMKQGLNPVDKNGMKYHINVDHIIERSGGGNLSLTKAPDNNNGDYNSFFVNHFNNFIILPVKIHTVKNTLNEAQNAAMTLHGKSQWVLMMIPENSPKFSGFVAQPQDKSHPLSGLNMIEESIYDHIGQANYLLTQSRRAIINIVPEAISPNNGKYIENLREVFNKAISVSPKKEKDLEKEVSPKIIEATKQLKNMFNKASRKNSRSDERKSFMQFMNGAKLRDTSELLGNLPLKAANDFHAAVKGINKEIAEKAKLKNQKPNSGNSASQKNSPK